MMGKGKIVFFLLFSFLISVVSLLLREAKPKLFSVWILEVGRGG